MALPELNSTILPDNSVVTIHSSDGAKIETTTASGNSLDTTVVNGNEVVTTHNTVPVVETIIMEDGDAISTTVDGFWDVVWSVNGQTGDVVVSVVIGEFLPNTLYRKGAAIYINKKLYAAKQDFTTSSTFDPADWNRIENNAGDISWGSIVGDISDQTDLAEELSELSESVASKQPKLTPGTGISIDENNVISNTQTSAEWGNIQGTLSDQTDLATALGNKVDKEIGKGLSTNDYTTEEKNKLSGIESGAQKNLANTVVDSNYVHTDNNYTNEDKADVAEIDNIVEVIPIQATSSNQLADRSFVNSSINSVTAYYITRNAQGEQFNTKAQLDSTTVFYSGGEVRVPTRNDYCIVLADETKTDPVTQESPTTRYIYQNNHWEFQYVVNKTSLTSDQLAAVNSGITASRVTKLNGIEAGAEVNVQSNWNQTNTNADDFIKNKPTQLVRWGNSSEITPSPWVDASMIIWQTVVDKIYPVGSIYMSSTLDTATKVHNALGGVWQAWGSGRVPVGVDGEDNDFEEPELTGGEKEHTLLTEEMPSHVHAGKGWASVSDGSGSYVTLGGMNGGGASVTTYGTGGDQPHNNLQPYITCYMWKRIG